MKKLYDLAVKVGTYQKDGQEKGRYENIGAVMEKDDGGRMILMKRTFNPAGVPNPDNRDNIIVSMFAPKGKEGTDLTPSPDAKAGADTFNEDNVPF